MRSVIAFSLHIHIYSRTKPAGLDFQCFIIAVHHRILSKLTLIITSVICWLIKNIKVAESYPQEKLHTLFRRRIVFHFCSLALQEDLDQHFSFCQPVSLSLRCDSPMELTSLWSQSGILYLCRAKPLIRDRLVDNN